MYKGRGGEGEEGYLQLWMYTDSIKCSRLAIHTRLLAVVVLSLVEQCMQLTDDAGMAGADTDLPWRASSSRLSRDKFHSAINIKFSSHNIHI